MSSALRSSRSSRIGKREAFLGCLVINQPMISFSGTLASPYCPFPCRPSFLPPPTSPLPQRSSKYSRFGWGSQNRTRHRHVRPHMLGRTLRCTWEGAGRGRGGAGYRPNALARWPPRPLSAGVGAGGGGGREERAAGTQGSQAGGGRAEVRVAQRSGGGEGAPSGQLRHTLPLRLGRPALASHSSRIKAGSDLGLLEPVWHSSFWAALWGAG